MSTAKRKHARVQPEVAIPDKIYFRIGEVSELASLPAYVLRFWETEFPQLKPTKSNTGQRMYRRKDVENVMRIRRLLYEEGFTIAGAREKLREEAREHRATVQPITLAAARPVRPESAPETAAEAEPLPLIAAMESASHKEQLRRLRHELSSVLDLLR
ncbi:MAG: MerR family transcriptional regulator [Acidobacteriota bacterium]|nr:MerR family transcriptional regulator [Acidobacteriota bacterium]